VPRLPATSLSDPTVLRECPAEIVGAGESGLPVGPYPVPPNSYPRQEPGRGRHRPAQSAGGAEQLVVRFPGRRPGVHGVPVELHTQQGSLSDVELELRQRVRAPVQINVVRVDTKSRRVVLRRAHDVPIPADLYTLIAYLRGITGTAALSPGRLRTCATWSRQRLDLSSSSAQVARHS